MCQKKRIDKVTKSRVLNEASLTLIWVGFSGVHFACVGWGRGGKLPPVKNVLELCYKLEIWYISTHTHTYVVSKNISFSTNNPLILLILVFCFFAKNQHFLVKNSTFTQNNSTRAMLEVFLRLAVCLLSPVIGPSFMSISLLVLEI